MKKSDVVEKLANHGLNGTPEVIEKLAEKGEEELNYILSKNIQKPVIEVKDIEKIKRKKEAIGNEIEKESEKKDDKEKTDKKEDELRKSENTKPKSEKRQEEKEYRSKTEKTEKKIDKQTKDVGEKNESVEDTSVDLNSKSVNSYKKFENIHKDITGESTTTGTYEDFRSLFRDRFEKLSKILRRRISPVPIADLNNKKSKASVVGMVKNIYGTKSGNYIIELEDPTGEVSVHVSDNTPENIVKDEVIGVKGNIQDDLFFADSVYFPDVPRKEPNTTDKKIKVAFVSDLHVGSKEFDERKWRKFKDWIYEREDIQYLLIAGDLADGVGVYSDQEKELDIESIREQYKKCAELLGGIPLDIIVIPGNHDTVRRAEPQPAFPENLQELFEENVTFTGNPSRVEIEGMNIMMYHGTSINPLVEKIPDISLENPENVMEIMLKKRHLAPMHGDMRLTPEKDDYLVIEDTPDIIHTGHSHILGVGKYKNILTINSGAWQKQTAYQKSKGIDPDVGYATLVDLSTLDVEIRSF